MYNPADDMEEYKRQRWYEEEHEPYAPEDPCDSCGGTDWRLVETTVYGDDADGRRGVPLYVYECMSCHDETLVTVPYSCRCR